MCVYIYIYAYLSLSIYLSIYLSLSIYIYNLGGGGRRGHRQEQDERDAGSHLHGATVGVVCYNMYIELEPKRPCTIIIIATTTTCS